MSVRVVAGVMKGDPPQSGPPEQTAELIGVPLRVNGSPGLVGDHVLAAPVPVQPGDCRPVGGARGRALFQLSFAQRGQRGRQLAVEWERPLAVAGLGLFEADPVLDQDPGLVDGERPGPQVDVGPAQAEHFTAAQAVKR
jgi:hypothetical protein